MNVEPCRTAADHAQRASALLASVYATEARLSELTPEEDVAMWVSGGYTESNKNVEHTVRLAIAHALTALALDACGRGVDADRRVSP